MIEWSLQRVSIKLLKAHPKNPRTISRNQQSELHQSITKFGVIDKIVVNADFQIIGGHQRVAVLNAMGHKEVDCYVPDRQLDDKEVEELMIRLNRNQGEWDWDVLANEFDGDDLLSWGFTDSELFDDKIVSSKPKKLQLIIEFTAQENLEEAMKSNEVMDVLTTYNGILKQKRGNNRKE